MKTTLVLYLLLFVVAFCPTATCQTIGNQVDIEIVHWQSTNNFEDRRMVGNVFTNLAFESWAKSNHLQTVLQNALIVEKSALERESEPVSPENEKKAETKYTSTNHSEAPVTLEDRKEMTQWSSNSAFKTDAFKNTIPDANRILGLQSSLKTAKVHTNIVVSVNRNSLIISPNPNERSLNILVPVFMQGSLEITNLEGELLKTIRFRGAEIAVDLDFPSGKYLVKAVNQAGKTKGEAEFSIE